MDLMETKDREAMQNPILGEQRGEVFVGPEEKRKIIELVNSFRTTHKSERGMLELAEVYFVAASVLANRLNDDPAQFDKFISGVVATINENS